MNKNLLNVLVTIVYHFRSELIDAPVAVADSVGIRGLVVFAFSLPSSVLDACECSLARLAIPLSHTLRLQIDANQYLLLRT